MTNTDVLKWIKRNLAPIIIASLDRARIKNPSLLYAEDWLAAIACRETGRLITRYPNAPLADVSAVMRGDLSQRDGEFERRYHGYGFWQADIDSFPDFVRSGAWKDPVKACDMAIAVLEGKRAYISQHSNISGEDLARAVTAAYNCGEGNVMKVLTAGQDIDSKTTDHNYSKNVWEFRAIYQTL